MAHSTPAANVHLAQAATAAAVADNPVTAAAIGLLAYLTADIAHHAIGHGGACLLLGGQLLRLTSIRTTCTCTGAAIDLGGPLANFLLGAAALVVGRLGRPTTAAMRLFWLLTAAFNLFYAVGQLAYCAATNTDDWWWPLQQAHAPAAARYALAALALLLYAVLMRWLAKQLAPFATPVSRATRLVGVAWLAAGAVACSTAALDHPATAAILEHALPQALLLPIGLWLLPARATHQAIAAQAAPALAFSWGWVAWAVAASIGSVLLLGPGFSFR